MYLTKIKNKKNILYIHTQRLKSLWALGSVWGKTTLNTGSVGGAGEDPKT